MQVELGIVDVAEFQRQREWLAGHLGCEEAEGLMSLCDVIADQVVYSDRPKPPCEGCRNSRMNPYHHAVSSAKKWGGTQFEYQAIHDWFDASKAHYGDQRRRALRHHSEGIFECEERFGKAITISTGRVVPVRWVAEQHVIEDLGFIPSLKDWLQHIDVQPWMRRVGVTSREVEVA